MAGLFSGPAFLAILKLAENEWFNTKKMPVIVGIQVMLSYLLLSGFQILQAWIYDKYKTWQITYYFFALSCIISFILFLIITIYDKCKESNTN